MKILAIVSRDLEKGSTKFRLAQYLGFLKENGIEVEFVRRKDVTAAFCGSLDRFDLVFNQKCLLHTSVSRRILAGNRKTIFDFDDAIYTRPGKPRFIVTGWRVRKRLHFWLERASVVTTANRYLAAYAGRHSSAVRVIPMAVDTDVWTPAEKAAKQQVVIGWTGSPVNIPNIERLGPVLGTLTKRYPFVKIAVSSGEKPSLPCAFEYTPFEPGTEADFVRQLDIGLLPLTDEEYSRGKSPIKAIQYLACGLPVVGTVFGATAEILTPDNSIAVSSDDEWLAGLERLIHDEALRKKLGGSGREFVLEHHSTGKVARLLLETLRGSSS